MLVSLQPGHTFGARNVGHHRSPGNMMTARISTCGCRAAVRPTSSTLMPCITPQAVHSASAQVPPSVVQSCSPFSVQSTCWRSSEHKRLLVNPLRSYAPDIPDYKPEPAYQEEEEEEQADYFRNGDVVHGVVDGIRPFGAFVKLNGTETSGLLHISQISNEHVDSVDSIFEVGEQVKVLITRIDREDGRISLNTRRLERNPGDMFTNKQAVWDGAEDMGHAVREEWAQRRAERRAENDGRRDRDDRDGFRARPRRDDGEGFRGRGRGGGGRGRGGGGSRGGGRGSYNRDGDRRQRREFE